MVVQDSTDVRRYEPAHAAMRPFDTLLCPLVVVVVQDSTDVSRYEPALSASNLYSASAKSFQQSRLHLENITNPTDEVLIDSAYILLLLHPFNGLFSRTTSVSWYQKGKTSLDLSEARDDGVLGWQWHQVDHMQTICTLHHMDNHTNTSSLNFYRPDALPGAHPTVSTVKALLT